MSGRMIWRQENQEMWEIVPHRVTMAQDQYPPEQYLQTKRDEEVSLKVWQEV